eukprot:12426508-Karenia_brevis.AAC.1
MRPSRPDGRLDCSGSAWARFPIQGLKRIMLAWPVKRSCRKEGLGMEQSVASANLFWMEGRLHGAVAHAMR